MPIGNHEKIIGNIELNDFYGFLYVDILAPDIKIPFLPIHLNNKLIFPTGKITGMYFSEELKYSLSLGYKIIKIHYGYKFDKGLIFNEFVTNFYNIKSNSNSTLIEKQISKLILNSLYGRFGLSDKNTKTSIINNDEISNYINKKDLTLITDLDTNNSLLKYENILNDDIPFFLINFFLISKIYFILYLFIDILA